MVESNAHIIMRCGRCQQNVPLSEMKYDKDGKTLVCQQCRGLAMQPHIDKLRAKQKAEITIPKARDSQLQAKGAGRKFRCTSCGYAFMRQNIVPTKCPYCGKASVVDQGAMASGRLLEDE